MLDTLANVKTSLLISGTTDDAVLRGSWTRPSFHRRVHRPAVRRRHVHRDAPGRARTSSSSATIPVDTVTSLKVDPPRQFGAETARDRDTFVVHTDRGVIESVAGRSSSRDRAEPTTGPGHSRSCTTATDAVPRRGQGSVLPADRPLVSRSRRQPRTRTTRCSPRGSNRPARRNGPGASRPANRSRPACSRCCSPTECRPRECAVAAVLCELLSNTLRGPFESVLHSPPTPLR